MQTWTQVRKVFPGFPPPCILRHGPRPPVQSPSPLALHSSPSYPPTAALHLPLLLPSPNRTVLTSSSTWKLAHSSPTPRKSVILVASLSCRPSSFIPRPHIYPVRPPVRASAPPLCSPPLCRPSLWPGSKDNDCG